MNYDMCSIWVFYVNICMYEFRRCISVDLVTVCVPFTF